MPYSDELKTKPTHVVEKKNAPIQRKYTKVKALFFFLLLLGVFGLGVYAANNFRLPNTREVATRPMVNTDGNATKSPDESAIASVAAKVGPSVVSIMTKSISMTYFGPSEQDGAGTGMIVSSDGYVMTNKHVVDSAEAVSVMTADGTTYEDVKVLGSDPLNDVAFLKINGAKDLPSVELGDSTTVQIGQRVVAIGNSLGQYQNTVTSGIISGTGRPISAQNGDRAENLTDLLQTDAAINPGNSGGPLLNLAGQVIGINTAVAANAEGIGFAIPIGSTKGVLKSVLAGKGVNRAYIGMRYLPVTPAIAKQYKLSTTKGAYLFAESGQPSVASGGPADKAGLKDEDIITAVNGVEVGVHGSVSTLIGEYTPGDTVELTVKRGNQTLALKVTLESYR